MIAQAVATSELAPFMRQRQMVGMSNYLAKQLSAIQDAVKTSFDAQLRQREAIKML